MLSQIQRYTDTLTDTLTPDLEPEAPSPKREHGCNRDKPEPLLHSACQLIYTKRSASKLNTLPAS